MIFKIFRRIIFIFISFTVFWVILYKYVNPPITYLMISRIVQHDKKVYGEFKFKKKWVKLNDISPNMILAVVAAEDNNFMNHYGIDWDAINKARKINKHSRIKHGASTISQQTAKNVFLFPSRTWIRKGLELYFTFLIEIFWGKKRIMEVSLNVVELGYGIYGVESASKYYFNKSASNLNCSESAMLAAILPSPIKRNPLHPSKYLLARRDQIISLMNKIGKVDF